MRCVPEYFCPASPLPKGQHLHNQARPDYARVSHKSAATLHTQVAVTSLAGIRSPSQIRRLIQSSHTDTI